MRKRGPSKERFEKILSEGKRLKGELCRISALPGTGLVGFGTARKIGNRPQRNRVKRRFNEGLRKTQDCISGKLDYVVIVGTAGATAALDGIADELRALLEKLNSRWASELECS